MLRSEREATLNRNNNNNRNSRGGRPPKRGTGVPLTAIGRKILPTELVSEKLERKKNDGAAKPQQQSKATPKKQTQKRPAQSRPVQQMTPGSANFPAKKRPERPLLIFDPALCARDVALYRRLGACSITNFATWLDGPYVAQHGPTDSLFAGFAAAFVSE